MEVEKKQELRNWLKEQIEQSSLSQNNYGKETFGWTAGTTSNVLTKWNVDGKVSDKTWNQLQSYKSKSLGYVGVETDNYLAVHKICKMAQSIKSAMPIEGKEGYGKSFALKEFKELNPHIKVYYIDISLTGTTSKRVVSEIMKLTGDYKAGTIQKQLIEIGKRLSREKALIILDEVSALQGYHVTVLKDIMTALDEVCGIVLSGTHYFIKNLNRGANRDRHLYGETRDRIFMHEKILTAPTDADAVEIFKANGLTDAQIKTVIGTGKYTWERKRTYRGIRDAIRLIKMIA